VCACVYKAAPAIMQRPLHYWAACAPFDIGNDGAAPDATRWTRGGMAQCLCVCGGAQVPNTKRETVWDVFTKALGTHARALAAGAGRHYSLHKVAVVREELHRKLLGGRHRPSRPHPDREGSLGLPLGHHELAVPVTLAAGVVDDKGLFQCTPGSIFMCWRHQSGGTTPASPLVLVASPDPHPQDKLGAWSCVRIHEHTEVRHKSAFGHIGNKQQPTTGWCQPLDASTRRHAF